MSLDSRYGICPSGSSARLVITCRKVKSDLLMSMLSLANRPSLPVRLVRSEPARSTSSIQLLRIFEGFSRYLLSTRIVSMEWLREELMLSR